MSLDGRVFEYNSLNNTIVEFAGISVIETNYHQNANIVDVDAKYEIVFSKEVVISDPDGIYYKI